MTQFRRTLSADLWPAEPRDGVSQPEEPSEPSDDMDYEELPCTDDGDDARWDAFIPDDDEFDPVPDPSDFWIEDCETVNKEKWCSFSRVFPTPCFIP